ncbi:MAG: DUF763 domain-containing protein [bacterium]
MRRGIADSPLHYGICPPWLFERMKRLGKGIIEGIVEEWGSEEVLRRLSDPFWFQALGCLLGFDWHSSGLTTTLCGALKEGIRGMERDLGLWIAGGKGKTSLKTPQEIEVVGDKEGMDVSNLIYASRMSAKVDNSALQDGYQIYHHTFVFTRTGKWCVIQQGMNEELGYARRYHWLSDELCDFVCEPHNSIVSQRIENWVLNMVAKESEEARKAAAFLSTERPEKNLKELERIEMLHLPRKHRVIIKRESLRKVLLKTYERKPKDFEELLGIEGVGPATIRALALLGELLFGAKPSYKDPVKFSFAHGGKDGHPYPVNREVYDKSIEVLERAVRLAKWGKKDKWEALRKLAKFYR